MTRWDRKLSLAVSRAVIRSPRAVLAALGVVLLAALAAMIDPMTGQPRFELDTSLESMVARDSAAKRYHDRIRELFENGDSVLIALDMGEVFTTGNLSRIQRISERIEALEHVYRVDSLSTVESIRSEDGRLTVTPFYDSPPRDPAALQALHRRAVDDPIYGGNLVSKDGRVALVNARLLALPDAEIAASGVVDRITAIVDEERGAVEAWITGAGYVKDELATMMMRSAANVIPPTWVVMALVAFVAFRTLRGVLLPLVTLVVAITISMSGVAIVYGRLNVLTMAAPPILIAVGLAYVIHVVAAYYEVVRRAADEGIDAREATRLTLDQVFVPVLFTGLTTAIGFLSLVLSPIQAIQQFAIFCAAGVAITVGISLSFVPALLALLPIPSRVRRQRRHDRLDAMLEGIGRFDMGHRRGILVAALGVAVVAAVGLTRVEIGTDSISAFQPETRVRRSFDWINANLEGANGLSVVFEAEQAGGILEPAALAEMERVQTWLEAQPEIGGASSLVEYMKTLNRAFHDDAREAFAIPRSRELSRQLLVIGPTEDVESFIDSEERVGRIVVRTSAMDSQDVSKLVDRIEGQLQDAGLALRSGVTGATVLVARTQDEVAHGQAVSLATALVFVFGTLALLFGSLRAGVLALLPNTLPILFFFGVLGWSGVTLNAQTAIVACLVLGVAVDDTIHLFAHFKRAAAEHGCARSGAVAALSAVGRPVTFTTVALCLSFGVMMLSESTTDFSFGWLSALTLAAAWAMDMTLTPVVASWMRVAGAERSSESSQRGYGVRDEPVSPAA